MAIDESIAVRPHEVSAPMSSPATSKPTKASPREVIRKAQELGVKIADLRFTDLVGSWQHFSIPIGELTESLFGDGIGFDGSSIRGFQKIHESDMLLFPDSGRTFVDPTLEVPTLAIVCDIKDPLTLQPYTRDPRFVAHKAEDYLLKSGIADTSYWGPECEFYIFTSIRYDQNSHEGYYHIDSDEGVWNTGKNGSGPNLGYRPKYKEGYFPVPPVDKQQDLRSRIVLALIDAGIDIEVHHHEVGTAGQAEIDMRYDTLVAMADKVLTYKHIVKNVCYRNGYTATFMPKPLFGDNGSGMHTHQSLWKDGTPLFYDKDGYALLSDTARWYIGGLLAHAPALLAFAAPTTNSYRRLVPGYEAPIKLAYSARNRSACVRIPTYSAAPAARRLEFRSPDPMCNPYLSFSAMLMAGLDGVKRKIEPPKPVDADLYELEGEEADRVKDLPGSLSEVLNALETDQDFLLNGDVFTSDLIDTYIAYKREREVDPVRLRPHPHEFFLYYDA
jgi:glutamine synthetase